MKTGWTLAMVCVALLTPLRRLSSQVPDSIAPDFLLKTLTGDTARLSDLRGHPTVRLSDLRGHPVFLNFWASWCKTCRPEMSDIIAAYNTHHHAGLEVLAINLTDQERMRDVRAFVQDLELPFPVLLDQKGKVRRLYALRGVPTSVFIDARGIVRLVNIGPITPETIQRGLNQILHVR